MSGAQDRGRDDVETVNSLEEFNDSMEMRDDIFFRLRLHSNCNKYLLLYNNMC